MAVRFHSHATERMAQRGAAEREVTVAVETGEKFKAKFGRTGFRRNFAFEKKWQGKYYKTKQIEAYVRFVRMMTGWLSQ